MPNARQSLIAIAFTGAVIWCGACANPALAIDAATPVASPAARAAEARDCAIAAPRFDFGARRATAPPAQVRAIGGGRVRGLVAAPCPGGPIAHDI